MHLRLIDDEGGDLHWLSQNPKGSVPDANRADLKSGRPRRRQ